LTSTGAAIKSYQTLGFYGASKAALRHIGQTLGEEEPDVITLSVAPGTVDTEMQKNIRESGHSMHRETHEYFQGLFNEGKLLEPEQPGNVMARLVLECPREFSGKSFR
jgi:NAD(P)-dependent dehydrogenase (short-subunit alcohol dehydrogenase family)